VFTVQGGQSKLLTQDGKRFRPYGLEKTSRWRILLRWRKGGQCRASVEPSKRTGDGTDRERKREDPTTPTDQPHQLQLLQLHHHQTPSVAPPTNFTPPRARFLLLNRHPKSMAVKRPRSSGRARIRVSLIIIIPSIRTLAAGVAGARGTERHG